jgi:hypothetical protein
MALNIDREIRTLRRMTVNKLRDKYLEVFGEETRSRHKVFLIKRIAWRMQANEYGGLSERARRRAEQLANDADLRLRAPRKFAAKVEAAERTTVKPFTTSHDRRLPMPGTVLTREYRGELISVAVLDEGYEHEGAVYKSLTAVAKAVTGSHWNGYHFFGLGKRAGGRN